VSQSNPPPSSSGVDSGRGPFGLTPRPAQFAPSSKDPYISPPTKFQKLTGSWPWQGIESGRATSPGPNAESGGGGRCQLRPGDQLMLSSVVGSHGCRRCPATPSLNKRGRHTLCHEICCCCSPRGVCLPTGWVNARLRHFLPCQFCNVLRTQRRPSILDLPECKKAGA